MVDFQYQEMFPLAEDMTQYRRLTQEFITKKDCDGTGILNVAPQGLALLAEQAFKDVSHFLRSAHLQQLANILEDPDSSDNDRFVALELLKNAVIASMAANMASTSASLSCWVAPK